MNKTLLRIFLATATLVAVASCSIENPDKDKIRPGGTVELTAATEAPLVATEARTSLASDTATVVWSTNDAFALLGSDGAKSRFTLASGYKTATGTFNGTVAGTAPYYAIYPYSDDVSLSQGEVHFKLPQTQSYVLGNIAQNVNPAIATIPSLNGTLQFKNLCGILCLQLTGDVVVSKVILRDLGGNMLWGDCTVALDGKEGTAEQTMTLTGGDNTLTLDVGGSFRLLGSSQRTLYFIVPAGSLDRGFSVTAYDTNDNMVAVIQTQVANTMSRSVRLNMPKAAMTDVYESADPMLRGYYKDLFMDSGIGLTSRTTLPATSYLGLEMEYYASLGTGSTIAIDTTIQTEVFIGSTENENGVLLYPDNEPRFRVIYVNGGKSTQHGASLGDAGRKAIRTYYANGGAYVGTCAGCLISSKGYDSYSTTSTYFGIWPGHTYHTKTDSGKSVTDTYTSMTIEPGSPLLKYYNYGNDMQIDNVRHNGGCYMGDNSTYPVPAGTEILLRYLTPGADSTKLNGSVSAWAYKATEVSGRLCVIGSHPEGVSSGEQRDLFSAMIRYATEGNGIVTPKGVLSKGTARVMDKKPSANKPAYAGIGDKQYHHFTIEIPEEVNELTLSLSGIETNCDLYLALAKDRLAWLGDAEYQLCSSGPTKTLRIKHLPAGTWSVAVYCPVTVTSTLTQYTSGAYYYKYTGNTEVLNGIPYRISVNWNSTGPDAGTGTNQPAVPITGSWD